MRFATALSSHRWKTECCNLSVPYRVWALSTLCGRPNEGEPPGKIGVGGNQIDAAAQSVRHATKRWSWFSTAARRAPYLSGLLIVAVGLYVGYHGWLGLPV